MERGDFVTLSRDGEMDGSGTVRAMVALASENQKSLMLMFNGAFCGHYGSMPVLMDDAGVYRSIADRRAVTITAEEK